MNTTTTDSQDTNLINALTPVSYAFKPWSAGIAARTGYRVAAVKFKTNNKTGTKKQSVYAELPVMKNEHLIADVAVLLPAIRVWCEETQDAIVKEAVLAGVEEVSESQLTTVAIVAWIAEQATSGRLTGEAVAAWFAEQMEAPLLLALSEKTGISEVSPVVEQKKLESMVEVYKEKILALASGRTRYARDVAEKLLRAFEVAGLIGGDDVDADSICEKLVSKLQAMMRDEKVVDLMAL